MKTVLAQDNKKCFLKTFYFIFLSQDSPWSPIEPSLAMGDDTALAKENTTQAGT